jgi:hypothetical protein
MEAHESERTLVLLIAGALIAGALMLGLRVSTTVQVLGQTAPERFWLAGRYDGNRIIVYFEAVKFEEPFPRMR